MTTPPDELKNPTAELLLALADDKLMLGHRNSDWTGLGPILEEDIAFSSLAQDEIAHAQAIYELAGELRGQSANELAFGRPVGDYRSAAIVETPDEFDWATAICRQFFCDHFDLLRLNRLAASSWKELADLAARLVAEERIHVEHADTWMRHLGRGSEEARDRMQKALDSLSTIAPMLLEPVEGQDQLEQAGIYPPGSTEMFTEWRDLLEQVATDAGLTFALPARAPNAKGGRRGAPSEHRATLLDEMCEVYRLEPSAPW